MAKGTRVRVVPKEKTVTVDVMVLESQLEEAASLAKHAGQPITVFLSLALARGINWGGREYIPAIDAIRERRHA